MCVDNLLRWKSLLVTYLLLNNNIFHGMSLWLLALPWKSTSRYVFLLGTMERGQLNQNKTKTRIAIKENTTDVKCYCTRRSIEMLYMYLSVVPCPPTRCFASDRWVSQSLFAMCVCVCVFFENKLYSQSVTQSFCQSVMVNAVYRQLPHP